MVSTAAVLKISPALFGYSVVTCVQGDQNAELDDGVQAAMLGKDINNKEMDRNSFFIINSLQNDKNTYTKSHVPQNKPLANIFVNNDFSVTLSSS